MIVYYFVVQCRPGIAAGMMEAGAVVKPVSKSLFERYERVAGMIACFVHDKRERTWSNDTRLLLSHIYGEPA